MPKKRKVFIILREVSYAFVSFMMAGWDQSQNVPTLEDASVRLFRVVDFPEDGLPTKPIKGSLPILYTVLLVVIGFGRCC